MSNEIKVFVEDFAAEIRRLTAFVNSENAVDETDLKDLSAILAKLLDFGQRCPDGEVSCDDEMPATNRERMIENLQRRFPTFGYYNVVPPIAPTDKNTPNVGDAIDDIYDIICELSEVGWHITNGRGMDGLWHAKILFPHWGRHAIDLKSYLHKNIYGW